MKRFSFFSVPFLVVAACSGGPQKAVLTAPPEMPEVLEAYGDSLAVGFLSDTSLKTERKPADLAKLKDHYRGLLAAGRMEELIQKPRSWPTKLAEIYSQFGKQPEIMNAAAPGATSDDLAGQVASFPPTTAKTVAFFFIGHNDLAGYIFSNEFAAEVVYHERLAAAVKAWSAKHTHSIAYLIPVGPVDKVLIRLSTETWAEDGAQQTTCGDVYGELPFGATYAALVKGGKASEVLGPRIEGMHRSLDKIGDHYAKWENGNSVIYLSTLKDQPIDPSYFAVDCFHLSEHGQTELAEKIYRALNNN